MSSPSKITLYDVQSTLPGKAFSPYSVRIRLMLDYRQIPYETAWIDFPDIEATAKSVGALPTKKKVDGNPAYTIPFIVVASPDKPSFAISDSFKIAQYIEDAYPDPDVKLLPTETRVLQFIFSTYLAEILGSTYKLFISNIVRALPENTREWFISSRKSTTGKGLETVPTDEAGIAAAWKEFEDAFDKLAAHLDAIGDGNYRVTGGASYSEFALVSTLYFLKIVSFDECWKRLEGRNDGRWAKLLDLPLYKKLLPDNRI